MVRKSGIIFLCCLLICTLITPAGYAAQTDSSAVERISNDFVEVLVSEETGRYSIRTTLGHPLRQDDDGPLLFLNEIPETSFTTFRINGQDYIFGESYGYLGKDGEFLTKPANAGLTNQSSWKIDGVEIIQTITLIDDVRNPNVGNVKISYEVLNTNPQPVSVGSRVLLDTMLGAEDSTPVSLSNSNLFIEKETDLSGSQVPAYWRSVDDPLNPKFVAYGFLQGWNNLAPDRMIIAHWEGISSTTWDYQIEGIDLTNSNNRYGSSDSAVALYWNPRTIQPDESIRFETYYGLGSLYTAVPETGYAVNFYGIKELTPNADLTGYEQEYFDVYVEIDNSGPSARVHRNLQVELGLPIELELAEGEEWTQTIGELATGQIVLLTWRVKATPLQFYRASRYWVTVKEEGFSKIYSDYVILPALSGAQPVLQVMELVPKKKFIEREDLHFELKGKGFYVLVNNWDATLKLVRESDQKVYELSDWTVRDDTRLTASMEELWADGPPKPGIYRLELDAGDWGSFTQKIELTDDIKFKSKNYSLLAVVKRNKEYRIYPAASESELQNLSGDVLLTIRGKILEYRDGDTYMYDISSGATINSVVQYHYDEVTTLQFGGSEEMLLVKRDGVVSLTGTGVLSIPAFPFVKGPFSIELKDGTDYALDPDEEQAPIVIHWDMIDKLNEVVNMSIFPVTIKQAALGARTVSFGGSVSLKVGGLGGFAVDVDEARFGPSDQGIYGFDGLRAEGEIEMPGELIPGFKLGGQGRLLVDTIDHIYEVEANVNIKMLEVGGLFTLRFTDSSFPVVDNFEFYVGGEPGIPLIPVKTIAYLTKIGGGIHHIYDTITGNFAAVPPLKLIAIGGISIGGIISADTMRLEYSLRGLSFNTNLSVKGFEILKSARGSILAEDSLTTANVEMAVGADVNLMGVITGGVQASITSKTPRNESTQIEISGRGELAFSVPSGIWFIGGRRLASVNGYIGTGGISASTSILGIPIRAEYYWGNSYPSVRIASLTMPELPKEGLGTQAIWEDGSYQGTMVFGTNIREVAKLYPRSAARNGAYRILADTPSEPYHFNIQDLDYAIIELAYSGETPPNIEVIRPDESVYTLVEEENYATQFIPADESESGLDERYVYVTIVHPENGTWQVRSDRELEGGRLLAASELPKIQQVTAELNGSHEVSVTWTSAQAAKDMVVELYLSEDNESDPGRVLSYDLPATGHTAISLPDTLPSGDYYIRAVLRDGDMVVTDRYSDAPVRIVNPYELPAPADVEIRSIGNGLIQAEWVLEEEADGFILEVLDEAGKSLDSMGLMGAAGDQRIANLGGTFQEPDSDEVYGIIPGHTYRVAVTGYKQVDGVQVFGQTAVSEPMFLPVPEPAEITMKIMQDGQEATLAAGDDERPAYLVNQEDVELVVEADQEVSWRVTVNQGEEVWLEAGEQSQFAVHLTEGLNNIDVAAIDEQGDMTLGSIQVRLDTRAPELMLEQAESVITAADGVAEIRGIVEAGSRLYANGQLVSVNENGEFAAAVSMDDWLWRELELIVEDLAGNQTVAGLEMIQEVDGFERVEIRQASAHLLADESSRVDLELKAGQTRQLELVGYDADGHPYRLPADRVEWSFLLGDSLASIEQGLLDTHYAGDLVVHAAYRISDDYALQDVLTVKITPASERTQPAYDDWYDENWVDPYPRDGRPGSGSPTTPPVQPVESTEDDVDALMREILQTIIEAEQEAVFKEMLLLQDDVDQEIQVGDRFMLKIQAQVWNMNQAGIGVGVVTDKQRYDALDGKVVIGEIYEIKSNRLLRFESPPVLYIRYDPAEVEDPSKLAIYWFNERLRRWEFIGNQLDTENHIVYAELPHFSKYALIYNEQLRRFADMEGRWSSDAVYRLTNMDVISGIQESGRWIFAPDRQITRQEFAKMLAVLEGLVMSSNATIPFTYADYEQVSSWAVPYMSEVLRRGWMQGSVTNHRVFIRPLESLTRAEAAVILARVSGAESGGADLTATFRDAEAIPAWAQDAVAALTRAGVITGYPDGTFRPLEPIKREEAAVMLLRFMQMYHK